MRLWLGVVAVLLTLLAGAPPPAHARDCGDETCGAPSCWDASGAVRPGRTRTLSFYCQRLTAVRLLEQPDDATVSGVGLTSWSHFEFTIATDADATGEQRATFELTGHGGVTTRQTVWLRVVPPEENTPPVCSGDTIEQRSDGQGPVTLLLHPYCRDRERDVFTIDGTGPGIHTQAPRTIPSGDGDSNWWYRTSTSAGTEATTVFATDELGARSEDATLTMTVGPQVDAPSTCMPLGTAYGGYERSPIFTRPGVTRRFGLMCEDPDGDVLEARLERPTNHGLLRLEAAEDDRFDGTYAPLLGGVPSDPFDIRVDTVDRGATTVPFAFVQRPLPENGGGGCGYGAAEIPPATRSVVTLASCSDDEGDPLSAEVVTPPAHGAVGRPQVEDADFGAQAITVPYTPDDGFEGVDCVTIDVFDEHGTQFRLTVDLVVREPPAEAPPEAPSLGLPDSSFWAGPPFPTPVPPPVRPAVGAPASRTAMPADAADLARVALGTPLVRRVRVLPGVEAWAPATLSRARLARDRRVPGLFVTCRDGCGMTTRATWTPRRRGARLARVQHSSADVSPGTPQVVWADAGRGTRIGRRLALRVRVTAGERRRTVRRTLRVAR